MKRELDNRVGEAGSVRPDHDIRLDIDLQLLLEREHVVVCLYHHHHPARKNINS